MTRPRLTPTQKTRPTTSTQFQVAAKIVAVHAPQKQTDLRALK